MFDHGNLFCYLIYSSQADSVPFDRVWIIGLLFAPMLNAIFHAIIHLHFGIYLSNITLFVADKYKQTGTLVRIQGIITELVFEHALRIRMKDDALSDTKSDGNATTTPTQDTPQSDEPEVDGKAHVAESSTIAVETESPASVSSSPKGKAKSSASAPSSHPATPSTVESKVPESSNLVGKITNLITTDLWNITQGRDFLLIVLFSPLQIGFCIWFLWEVLGWA